MSDALYKTGTRFILASDSDGDSTLYTIESKVLDLDGYVYLLSYTNKKGVLKTFTITEYILDMSVKDDIMIMIR